MRIGGAKIFSSITNVDPSRNKGMAVGQQFFITENGYIGMRNSQIYDKVFFLTGSDVPFVLRSKEERS